MSVRIGAFEPPEIVMLRKMFHLCHMFLPCASLAEPHLDLLCK